MKYYKGEATMKELESPSARREWVEILPIFGCNVPRRSPSARREWVEIFPASR